ncbi:LacI family DNA-binding transcriptional regulator [Actinoplanes sp. NPDC049548]|uniref:LacI family DNA-binding transcriptional regulator n=1 Tax=Actinoplanes sp. NPDC049548 TaxID=3155152 RepID=UPI003448F2B4
MTQQDIARMTGVSQATVSLVLNGRADGDVRIAPETRERVLQALRRTGYVARHNRILGVFAEELGDLYHPYLAGIEERAEQVGCDLLLLTGAPVVDGRRRIFHQDNRLRLTDGCILLGRSLEPGELARLTAEGHPFVSVGRRDDARGPLPYVGADHRRATAARVRDAVALGHRRLVYVDSSRGRGGPVLGEGIGSVSHADRLEGFAAAGVGPESHADRLEGFAAAAAEAGVDGRQLTIAGSSPADVLDALHADGRTCVFVEAFTDGVSLARVAAERGLRVPEDLSFVALGDPVRLAATDLDFTGYRIPRREMGRQAVEVLAGMLTGADGPTQRILECPPVTGATLAAA